MEKIAWKVDGMTCANCALNINKTLENKGMTNISVNAISGEVSFETADATVESELKKKVEGLGYKVFSGEHAHAQTHEHNGMSKYMLRFWISLPFTLLLMLHMIPGVHLHWLMQPWVQFGLALPVFLIGMEYFGKSAFNSIRGGVPNMDVLITIGSFSAFAYSTYGLFTPKPEDFLFFETAASIITIVFFGNWLEDVSVNRTQKVIKELTKTQVVKANMIAYDDQHQEQVFEVDSTALRTGDLILIRTGEQVPADCKMLSGEADVSEALLSGEATPVLKKQGDVLVGGSVVVNGNLKAYVTAVGKDTVMSGIQEMMKKAQTEKPPVQQLADKISGIFIPIVLGIALLTLLGNFFIGDHTFKESLMRCVAVLVIACPCAMGLATPAAIAVGLGRAARYGILYTDVKRMELFKDIRQMVFDKTGTLTSGKFSIAAFAALEGDETAFKKLVFSLEKFSNHPIAKSIADAWRSKDAFRLHDVEEVKGEGMKAADTDGNVYRIGSAKILSEAPAQLHSLYVTKNDVLIGWLDIEDEIRPEAKDVINYCKAQGITTILLSGDSVEKCAIVANALGIDVVHAAKSPAEKLQIIDELVAAKPTVMVGDGINDAPALAKATISVSLSEASQLAIQSAGVVLTSHGLKNLPKAMQLGKLTYGTVKSNLFWAFFYNSIAIPVAAFGFLHPTLGALIMGGSDVVLAINSLWLGVRKLK
ncbi:MAG: cadmium-translocating P-type ATPase [Chitinophagaceae bacterium]|nr:cadmium-translocating P-type ATPase [Chitinophagaceae bacterium]